MSIKNAIKSKYLPRQAAISSLLSPQSSSPSQILDKEIHSLFEQVNWLSRQWVSSKIDQVLVGLSLLYKYV